MCSVFHIYAGPHGFLSDPEKHCTLDLWQRAGGTQILSGSSCEVYRNPYRSALSLWFNSVQINSLLLKEHRQFLEDVTRGPVVTVCPEAV